MYYFGTVAAFKLDAWETDRECIRGCEYPGGFLLSQEGQELERIPCNDDDGGDPSVAIAPSRMTK